MRAVVIRNHQAGISTIDDPVPGPNEVIVAIAAAGLNAADLMQIQGGYRAPAGWPSDIPGLEFAGVVAEIGSNVADWTIGERVMGLAGGGAHAERLAVPAAGLLRIPDSIDFVTAAGFPEAYFTAWDALVTQARLTGGERVLVTGATGGVGTAAVQIARHLGADVFARVRTDVLAQRLAELAPGISTIVSDDAGAGAPFDVVLELVGGSSTTQRIPHLRIGGRIVVIGVGAGSQVDLPLHALMSIRGRIMGSTLRSRPEWEKTALARSISSLLVPLFGRGTLRVPIDSRFPLERAGDAYDRMSQSGKFGKVILEMDR